MKLGRRSFIRLGGAGLVAAGFGPRAIFSSSFLTSSSSSTLKNQLFDEEYTFPYDTQYFECAERVSHVRRSEGNPSIWKANVNLILREGKRLDIKVLASEKLETLAKAKDVYTFYGVQGDLDVVLGGIESRRYYYQVLYKDGASNWKALSPKGFKIPTAALEGGGQYTILLLADDHTFDDADYIVPEEYKKIRLSGDYVNEMLKELRFDPYYRPSEPLGSLRVGYTLASTLRHIMASEDPDIILNLGDTPGVGARHKYAGLGLPTPGTGLTDKDYNYIAKTMWMRKRRMYSALSPHVPVYFALGNHDGETGWNETRFRSREWRQKLFTSPDTHVYSEGGHQDGNYFALTLGSDHLNRGGAQFIILDVCAFSGSRSPQKPEAWTLGKEQLEWMEGILENGKRDWSFICYHHVLGGWPAGPDESRKDVAYGRGPLFTANDYTDYCNPDDVEQVRITEMAKKYGVRAFLYGHDHIFHAKNIGYGLNKKDIMGVCCGSPKYVGEDDWWSGYLWREYYGDGFKAVPDFWGPPGITRLTINKERAKLEYVVSGISGHTNHPSGIRLGNVLQTTTLLNPLPLLLVEKTQFNYQGVEEGPNPSPQVLRIRNGGARALHYNVSSNQAWISFSSKGGSSWGEWEEIAVSVDISNLEAGNYTGLLKVESVPVDGSPKEVIILLTVTDPPIYPPLNFKAIRKSNRSLLYHQSVVELFWENNPLNRNIQKYRIFVLNDYGKWDLVAEVGSDTFMYLFRNARRNKQVTFGVAAVDRKGRIGEMAVAVAR